MREDAAIMTAAPSKVHVYDSEWTTDQHGQRSHLRGPSRQARVLGSSFLLPRQTWDAPTSVQAVRLWLSFEVRVCISGHICGGPTELPCMVFEIRQLRTCAS